MLGDIASLATAIGLLIAVGQLEYQRREARTSFEESLVRRYWDILDQLSVSARIGELNQITDEDRRAAHAYFRLCDEQVYLNRKRHKISKATWKTWEPGIRSTMGREPFCSEWQLIRKHPHLHEEYADLISLVGLPSER